MSWAISFQARDAYAAAAAHDPPVRAAMDRLWGRLDADPENEGVPLSQCGSSSDPHLRRILAAVRDLMKSSDGGHPEPRVSYEPVEGPTLPPPWLVASVHIPNWVLPGRPEDHTLIALCSYDRQGNAR